LPCQSVLNTYITDAWFFPKTLWPIFCEINGD
jgi:hypothetical protein